MSSKMKVNQSAIVAVQNSTRRKHRRQRLYMAALTVFAVIWMLPVIWTVSTSFRPEPQIQANIARMIPSPFTTDNWEYVLGFSRIPRWLFNSALVTVTRTVAQLVLCSFAAYAFARIDFVGRKIVYPIVLAGLMVPYQAVFIPVYLLFSDFGLLNTYIALILPAVASPFAIFLLAQFFMGIPSELEDSAYIDGASRFVVFSRIMIPLSVPALTTLAIFTFLGTWNDYLWPLVVATKDHVRTITIGLRLISSAWGYEEAYGRVMAAAWVGATPIVLFFFAFQRRILSGISMGSAIKS